MKLQQKLILLTTLSKAVMAAVLLLLLPWVLDSLTMRHTDADLRQELQQVQARIAQEGIEAFLPDKQTQARTHYDLLQDEFISLEPGVPARPDTVGTFPRQRQGKPADFRVLRHHLTYQGQGFTLEIGKSIESVENLYELLRTLAGYALVFVVLTTLLLELGVIGYLLRPMDQIVERLRSVQGPTPPPLPPLRTSTQDFQYLHDSIQQMLAKIKSVVEQEREFIGNASHELLTPISILQNRFENMLRAEILPEEAEGQLVASQKTLQRLTATLRTLLLISRVEAEQFARTEVVPVQPVLAEVAAELEDRMQLHDLRLEWNLSGEPVLSPANRTLLFTLFFNLLNNAIKYNQPGGLIELSGQPTEAGYTLRIRNTGAPIPPEHLPLLFERFHRINEASAAEGHGLGLAVVRSIAQFHAIGVQVESGEEGTVFMLHLPPAR